MTQAAMAEKLAREMHSGQVRKFGDDKGKPYIIHPERVAAQFPGNDTLQAIAWLHDVLEDTATNVADLMVLGFDLNVVSTVQDLTHELNVDYAHYIINILSNDLAVEVKIADIKDNLRDIFKGSIRDKYMLALYLLEEHK